MSRRAAPKANTEARSAEVPNEAALPPSFSFIAQDNLPETSP
jgi:hypothetical protein